MPVMESKYIIRIIVDFTLLCTVAGCIFVVKKLWPPFERGMYCDDESIRYPYTDHETVSDTALLLFGVALPMGLVSWEDNPCFQPPNTGPIPALDVAIPILLFFLLGKPFERGFNCDDESLRYPYKDSTVSTGVLYVVGMFLPAISMCLLEWWRVRQEAVGKSIFVFNREASSWFWASYTTIGTFLFGCACSQLSTDIAKYSVGRLRPHFVSVCKPDWSKINCTEDYVDPIPCTSEDAHRMKEARLSFPSGHASFSAYTMIYLAIYLQVRFKFKGPKLVRPFLQFVCLMMTFYTCLSRISDYKHHWSDVLSGFILGTTVAILISQYVSDLFQPQQLPATVSKDQTVILQDRRFVDNENENSTARTN